MSLIAEVGRKSWKSRFIFFAIYLLLSVMGICMVVPFLITITGSTSDDYDYDRFAPVPRYLYSEKDRFVKGLVPYFNGYRNWNNILRCYFPDLPSYWSNWSLAGRDSKNGMEFAERYLNMQKEHPDSIARMAEDYQEFFRTCDSRNLLVSASQMEVITFLIEDYSKRCRQQDPSLSGKALRKAALQLLNKDWGTPFENFYGITFDTEILYPVDFQTWFPPEHSPRYNAFLRFKDWQAAKIAPASLAIPLPIRSAWYTFLQSEDVTLTLGREMDIALYNRMAKTSYRNLYETPFPIPDSFQPEIRKLWKKFLAEYYPLRLQKVHVTPEVENKYRESVRQNLKSLQNANKLLESVSGGKIHFSSWNDFKLAPTPPEGDGMDALRDLWKNYVRTLPVEQRTFFSTEQAFQEFVLKKYGSLENLNQAYGTSYRLLNEVFPPFHAAYLVTFQKHQYAMTLQPVLKNYRMVCDFLLFNGNAILVTCLLILLTLFFTLTINPFAAYALSRFNLKGQDKIILFMLATMAFPTMVSAIPAYLLMRDLGMLNTFWALVLPGAANGMSIFILKGFFDSLPQELFEAATIDGANEFQIFRIVAMPLVKPILAINCLTAFMAAYNGWEWALIICQEKEMWTIAVWLYQASQWWSASPWLVSTGFILASIPTLLVFLSCQKIILKGIAIPTMK